MVQGRAFPPVSYTHLDVYKRQINEAVEMTKHYEEPEVVSFVNGILGSFVRNECPPEPVGLKPAAERPQDEA